jgi:hypothetical protein
MSKTAMMITMALSLFVAGAAFTSTGCATDEDCIGNECSEPKTEALGDGFGTCSIQCAKVHETCQAAPTSGAPEVCSTACEDDTFDDDEYDCVSLNPCDDDAVRVCLDQLPPLDQ